MAPGGWEPLADPGPAAPEAAALVPASHPDARRTAACAAIKVPEANLPIVNSFQSDLAACRIGQQSGMEGSPWLRWSRARALPQIVSGLPQITNITSHIFLASYRQNMPHSVNFFALEHNAKWIMFSTG
jgi:hypothetical protein